MWARKPWSSTAVGPSKAAHALPHVRAAGYGHALLAVAEGRRAMVWAVHHSTWTMLDHWMLPSSCDSVLLTLSDGDGGGDEPAADVNLFVLCCGKVHCRRMSSSSSGGGLGNQEIVFDLGATAYTPCTPYLVCTLEANVCVAAYHNGVPSLSLLAPDWTDVRSEISAGVCQPISLDELLRAMGFHSGDPALRIVSVVAKAGRGPGHNGMICLLWEDPMTERHSLCLCSVSSSTPDLKCQWIATLRIIPSPILSNPLIAASLKLDADVSISTFGICISHMTASDEILLVANNEVYCFDQKAQLWCEPISTVFGTSRSSIVSISSTLPPHLSEWNALICTSDGCLFVLMFNADRILQCSRLCWALMHTDSNTEVMNLIKGTVVEFSCIPSTSYGVFTTLSGLYTVMLLDTLDSLDNPPTEPFAKSIYQACPINVRCYTENCSSIEELNRGELKLLWSPTFNGNSTVSLNHTAFPCELSLIINPEIGKAVISSAFTAHDEVSGVDIIVCTLRAENRSFVISIGTCGSFYEQQVEGFQHNVETLLWCGFADKTFLLQVSTETINVFRMGTYETLWTESSCKVFKSSISPRVILATACAGSSIVILHSINEEVVLAFSSSGRGTVASQTEKDYTPHLCVVSGRRNIVCAIESTLDSPLIVWRSFQAELDTLTEERRGTITIEHSQALSDKTSIVPEPTPFVCAMTSTTMKNSNDIGLLLCSMHTSGYLYIHQFAGLQFSQLATFAIHDTSVILQTLDDSDSGAVFAIVGRRFSGLIIVKYEPEIDGILFPLAFPESCTPMFFGRLKFLTPPEPSDSWILSSKNNSAHQFPHYLTKSLPCLLISDTSALQLSFVRPWCITCRVMSTTLEGRVIFVRHIPVLSSILVWTEASMTVANEFTLEPLACKEFRGFLIESVDCVQMSDRCRVGMLVRSSVSGSQVLVLYDVVLIENIELPSPVGPLRCAAPRIDVQPVAGLEDVDAHLGSIKFCSGVWLLLCNSEIKVVGWYPDEGSRVSLQVLSSWKPAVSNGDQQFSLSDELLQGGILNKWDVCEDFVCVSWSTECIYVLRCERTSTTLKLICRITATQGGVVKDICFSKGRLQGELHILVIEATRSIRFRQFDLTGELIDQDQGFGSAVLERYRCVEKMREVTCMGEQAAARFWKGESNMLCDLKFVDHGGTSYSYS